MRSGSNPETGPPLAMLLVLATDPRVLDAARAAADRLGRPAILIVSAAEALARLRDRDRGDCQLVCEPAAAGPAWPMLLALATEPRNRSMLLAVVPEGPPRILAPGLSSLPADARRIAAALGIGAPGADGRLAGAADQGLACALARGEIAVHYQPVVGLADRRPVLLEALVRWQAQHPPLSPERFVAIAERAGLAEALVMAVAARAARGIAPLRGVLRLGLSVNLPLSVLLRPGIAGRLGRTLRAAGMAPAEVALELTESIPVHDRATLRRGLLRLRAAGHAVLLDDLLAGDPRARLLALPFAGVKLDRSLVASLPGSASAREEVRRIARAAARRGQQVVAEGVADPRLPSLLRDLGVGFAQGFLIGRPLPAEALPAWSARWRAGGAAAVSDRRGGRGR